VAASLEGLNDLLAQLKAIESDVGEQKQVHRAGAEIILGQAKRDVTVGPTGLLRRSGRVSATKRAGVVRFGNARVPYAGPYHFGHARRPQGGFMRPDPFLYDALDRRGAEVVRRYEAHVASVLRANT
jgi:hypothetical protein